jgi:hypothetical protein
VGHVQGRHLRRLAAQQAICETHLPNIVFELDDKHLDGHSLALRPRRDFWLCNCENPHRWSRHQQPFIEARCAAGSHG